MAAKKYIGTTTPGDLSVGANYSPAGLPATGDSLLIDGADNLTPITAGLAALVAVTLTSLTIKKSAPAIGTAAAKMQVGATLVNIGELNIDGTNAVGAFVGLDTGAVATNITIWGTATKGSGIMPPVQLAGSHASNKLTVKGSSIVGVAVGFGDTANFPEIDVIDRAATVTCGAGCSLTTLNQTNGKLTVNSTFTTLNQDDGEFWQYGTGNAGTVNAGGVAHISQTGTITAINATGTIDLSGNPAARTAPAAGIIPINAYEGSTININNGVKGSISCTVKAQHCRSDQITLITWPDTTLAFS